MSAPMLDTRPACAETPSNAVAGERRQRPLRPRTGPTIFRDEEMLCNHGVLDAGNNLQLYGRILVGLEPGTPFL